MSKSISPRALTVTHLEPILVDEPWQDFMFGDGVNVVSGRRADPAVSFVPPEATGPYRIEFSYGLVSSDAEYETAISSEFSASYNASQSIEAESDFASKVTFSENCMSIVVRCRVLSESFGQIEREPKLTPKAAEYLKDHGEQAFRLAFGDYFVENALFGAELLVVYNCHASESSRLLELKAKLAGGTSIVTANGASEFSTTAHKLGIQLSVSTDLRGVSGNPPDASSPEDVFELVKWFLEPGSNGFANIGNAPMRARLVHYRQIEPELFSATLPVNPLVFVRIRALRTAILRAKEMVNQLPDYQGRDVLREKVDNLISRFATMSEGFAEEPSRMDELEKDTADAQAQLSPLCAGYSFYRSLEAEAAGAPKNGYGVAYGIAPTAAAVPVNVADRWHGFTNSKASVTFPGQVSQARSGDFIVGWEIRQGDPWDRGSPAPHEYSIEGMPIGSPGASGTTFHVEGTGSGYPTVQIYWVSRKSFPWLVGPPTA